MPRYSAYGLTIDSQIDFPELAETTAAGEADLRVLHGDIDQLPPDGVPANAFYLIRGGLACARWGSGGLFRMKEGRELTMQLLPGAERDILRNLILGPFMAMLLHQRGMLVLHGSGVEIDGKAVAFIGDSGKGKSTIATAFMRAGYPPISDDLLAITVPAAPDAPPVVAPGPPLLKLWPEAARAFGHRPEGLPQITSTKEKRMVPIEGGSGGDRVPLGAIYILGDRSDLPTMTIAPQEGLLELTRHSYCVAGITDQAAVRAHFLQCTELVRRVPIRRLNRSFPLDRLAGMVDLVVGEVRR